jgi:hypothetical protein
MSDDDMKRADEAGMEAEYAGEWWALDGSGLDRGERVWFLVQGDDSVLVPAGYVTAVREARKP